MNAEATVGSQVHSIPKVLSVFPEVTRGRSSKPSAIKQLVQCALVAVLSCGSWFLVSHFVFQSVQVVGVSMVPALHDSDFYLLNRWAYLMRDPQPQDIVVLRDPLDNSYAVKRIIARSGDLVYLRSGHVYVNGRELREPYLDPGMPTFSHNGVNGELVKCGQGQYFVLGDNRKNSADSREYGPVPRQNILGLIGH